MSARPLHDIVVCDFTVYMAGPTATYALAQLGARVIKIERPHDPERLIPLTIGAPSNDEVAFASRNGGKESITVDLRTPEGAQVIRRLISRSDVVVENFGPGSMERLGLDYEAVRALNPRVIYASLKGFNLDTPWADFLAFDPVCQAAAGPMSITGRADGPPIRPGPPLGDIGAGVPLATGIVAALVQRATTGEGQQVFISMLDAGIHYMRPYFAANVATGQVPLRNGNLDPDPTRKAYCEVFPCRGGGANDYCVLEIDTDAEWQAFTGLTQLESIGQDARFATRELRHQHASALREVLVPWFASRTKREAMDCLVGAGIRAAAVLTPYDVMQDERLWGADTFSEMVLSDGSTVSTLAWPVKFSSFGPSLSTSPSLGQHTDAVLRDFLGYSEKEVAALRDRAAI